MSTFMNPTFMEPDNLSFINLPRDAALDSTDNLAMQRSSRQVHKAFYTLVTPEKTDSLLISFSPSAAAELGWNLNQSDKGELAKVFSGAQILPNSKPYAQAYAGHQFGVFAGQLGDGRAITLGEVQGPRQRWEVQLKGAGRTPYSRFGDGYAVLRSSIREYIASEYFARVGVPTTRALSLVLTPNRVVAREVMEPGAIVCRLAPSWMRIGSLELPLFRQWPEGIKLALNHLIQREFPELGTGGGSGDGTGEFASETYLEWFGEVIRRNAQLVAKWSCMGWSHGVLNTDNISLLGLTLDFGPYAWLDDYNPEYTPNHTDEGGRYSFGNQPGIMLWNLARLGRCMVEVVGDGNVDEASKLITAKLELFKHHFLSHWRDLYGAKLGLTSVTDDDVAGLIHPILNLLEQTRSDYTRFFRALSDFTSSTDLTTFLLKSLEKSEEKGENPELINSQAEEWWTLYSARPRNTAAMRKVNPKWVPRQWILQDIIDTCHTSPLCTVDSFTDAPLQVDGPLSIVDSAMRVLLHDTYGEISEDGAPTPEGWGLQEWMLVEKWSADPPSAHRNLMCSCSS